MLKDGTSDEYIFPPPAWSTMGGPEAKSHGVTNNLFDRWLDMPMKGEAIPSWQDWEQNGSIYGEVLTMEEFEKLAEQSSQTEPIASEHGRVNGEDKPLSQVPVPQLQQDTYPLKNGNVSEKLVDTIAKPGILASLPRKQLVWTVLVSLGINFAIPFVNGVMLGTPCPSEATRS